MKKFMIIITLLIAQQSHAWITKKFLFVLGCVASFSGYKGYQDATDEARIRQNSQDRKQGELFYHDALNYHLEYHGLPSRAYNASLPWIHGLCLSPAPSLEKFWKEIIECEDDINHTEIYKAYCARIEASFDPKNNLRCP